MKKIGREEAGDGGNEGDKWLYRILGGEDRWKRGFIVRGDGRTWFEREE